MTIQKQRQVVFQIGPPGSKGRSFRDLKITFNVSKTLSGTPNKGKIEVFGLNPDKLPPEDKAHEMLVRLYAGFDAPALIFQGNPIRNGYELTDRSLKVEVQDGLRTYQRARVNVNLATETQFSEVIDEVARQMGLPKGVIRVPETSSRLTQGLTFNGPAKDLLARLGRNLGATASIQDGSLQFLPDEDTANTGPLYSSELKNLQDVKRTDAGIKIDVLLDGQINPGDRFELRSKRISGFYKALRVDHSGDSGWGSDYTTTIEARESPT